MLRVSDYTGNNINRQAGKLRKQVHTAVTCSYFSRKAWNLAIHHDPNDVRAYSYVLFLVTRSSMRGLRDLYVRTS